MSVMPLNPKAKGVKGINSKGFAQFAGPTPPYKTYTLPNASCNILTDNSLVTAAQGGTANGFTAFTGPSSSTKTFTLPNATSTILTTNAAVTVPQGGTGLATLTTAYAPVCAGTTATGNLQVASTGLGTTGNVLTSNGSSALPSFQAIPSSSEIVLIATQTASSSSTLDFTSISASSYSAHLVVFTDLIAATNSVQLLMRLSVSGTFQTGAGTYSWLMYATSDGGNGGSGSSSTTSVSLSDSTNLIGTGTNSSISGHIWLYNLASTTAQKKINFHNDWYSTGGSNVFNTGGARFLTTSACDGIRLYMSSGNITSGTAYLYGLKNT